MTVTMYSTHCPKCRVLETKLKSKNIPFDVVDDVKEMTNLGIKSLPMLMVDGKLMDFSDANNWIKEQLSQE